MINGNEVNIHLHVFGKIQTWDWKAMWLHLIFRFSYPLQRFHYSSHITCQFCVVRRQYGGARYLYWFEYVAGGSNLQGGEVSTRAHQKSNPISYLTRQTTTLQQPPSFRFLNAHSFLYFQGV
jgi:hypothetical protein